jgi:hypothetical protein
MHLTIISVVRNEADIIETFVRHHCALGAQMIMTVHRSLDSTMSILRSLEREGLPITLAESDAIEHRQEEICTRCAQSVARGGTADWILPLDADEFLCAAGGTTISAALSRLPRDGVTHLHWKTYVPTPEDDAVESCPIRRIIHRRSMELPQITKCILPAGLLRERSVRIPMGAHQILDASSGVPLPSAVSEDLLLAHFPVRSSEQLTVKILGGWAAVSALPKRTEHTGHHWRSLVERCASGRSFTVSELRNVALRYATDSGSTAVPGLIRDPIATGAPRPRYPILRAEPLTVITDATLACADRIGALSRERKIPGNPLQALEECLREGITDLAAALEQEGEWRPIDPSVAAHMLLAATLYGILEGTAKGSRTALAWRHHVAEALPPLGRSLEWIGTMLAAPKLPFVIERPLQGILRTLVDADTLALRQECRRRFATDDTMLCMVQALTQDLRPPVAVAAATFLAQAAHHVLSTDMRIQDGMGDRRILLVDPACGRGEVLCEMQRRAVNAALQRGAHPDMLRADLLRRTAADDPLPLLRMLAALRSATLFHELRMPLAVTDDTLASVACNPHEGKDTIPVVCSHIPPDGHTGAWRLQDDRWRQLLEEYAAPLQQSCMEVDTAKSDAFHCIAQVHNVLARAETSLGALIAPRWMLHGYAAGGVREKMLQDFEQILILDLHGNPAQKESDSGDEPLDSSPPNGSCILLLVRSPRAPQQTLYASWSGLKLQKYHALLSRSIEDTPWQRITPESPGFLFLPSER